MQSKCVSRMSHNPPSCCNSIQSIIYIKSFSLLVLLFLLPVLLLPSLLNPGNNSPLVSLIRPSTRARETNSGSGVG